MAVGNGVGLGGCSGIDVPVEHNIRVMGVVVEVGGLLDTGSTAERVGKAVFPVKPRTEFDDTAFVRCEIEIVGTIESMQHIEVVGQPPIALVGECLRGEIGRVDEETDVWCMDVLCEEFAVVLAGNGEPVEVAVGTEIAEADGVVEVLLAECCKAGDIVAAEEDGSREGDVVHETSAVVAGYRVQYACAVGFDDAFVARVAAENGAQFGKEGVGGGNSRETPGVAVEIIVDDACVRTDAVREMGQQTAAAKEVNESGAVAELVAECGFESVVPTAFLPHKREWGLGVNFCHKCLFVWLFKKKVVILCALTVLQGLICRDIRHFADIYEATRPLTGTIVSSVAVSSLANVVWQEGKSVCQPQPRAFFRTLRQCLYMLVIRSPLSVIFISGCPVCHQIFGQKGTPRMRFGVVRR